MIQILEQAINNHLDLKDVCVAPEHRKRNPQILIYDVPVTTGDRVAEEATFINQLRYSNSFPPELDIRVLFKRPGRGPYQHWVLSVAPGLFNIIKGTSRLYFGFGSFKFREILEPTRCYKCLKFGHLKANCSALKELCSRSPGEHSYKACTSTALVCRNCKEFNRRSGKGLRLQTAHSAISDRCPIFLREREDLGRHTTYVS
ncbi:hypothetical protein AVEN_71992-1 [Araneus ventricosus]|uniref:CCHC-type domain-containing protein n=1 Tax=Araneus ventricosus TaxID=182803 RepID=A0A4Y2DDG5_ARAVE|nr:hypothetical protein AVEN_71992-1 [Araneus ventricosus]